MATPFIGEIRLFGFGIVPRGWLACNGQLLPISQNQALFSILGTTYGGDGITTFAMPNLQGRVPMSFGQGSGLQNYAQGTTSGSETITLTAAQGPPHTHNVMAIPAAATSSAPSGNMLAIAQASTYGGTGSLTPMSSAEVSTVGGQPHENRQPYLTIAYCIATSGIFPSRN